jgi:hypothetical protein
MFRRLKAIEVYDQASANKRKRLVFQRQVHLLHQEERSCCEEGGNVRSVHKEAAYMRGKHTS